MPYPDGNAIGGPLVGVGRYIAQGLTNLDKETGQGSPGPRLDLRRPRHHRRGDPETGEYQIMKIASAFDVGKVINPELVRGQCIGGMIQGLGRRYARATSTTSKAILLNPSLTDNKIPTSRICPRRSSASPSRRPSSTGLSALAELANTP